MSHSHPPKNVFMYSFMQFLPYLPYHLPNYLQVREAPVPDALPADGWAAAAAGVGGVAAAGAALHLAHQTRTLSHRYHSS